MDEEGSRSLMQDQLKFWFCNAPFLFLPYPALSRTSRDSKNVCALGGEQRRMDVVRRGEYGHWQSQHEISSL